MRVFQLYTKTDCPFCKHAIALLRREKEEFAVTVLDYAPAVLENIATSVNWNTVPIIMLKEDFKDNEKEDKFIGGFQELEKFLNNEAAAKKSVAKKAIDKYKENNKKD